MDILADENVPSEVVAALRAAGHDVAWIREDQRGTLDSAILERAIREHRVLLTFDLDFGQLIFGRGLSAPPGVILVRLPPTTRHSEMARLLRAVLSIEQDWLGNIATITQRGTRVRPFPRDV